MSEYGAAVVSAKENKERAKERGVSFRLTKKQIQRFLSDHANTGCAADTIRQYRSAISGFYDFLPENKRIFQDTLLRWHDALLEQGLASATACTRLSAVNCLLDYLGRRDFQWFPRLEKSEAEIADLTRAEYIQLLQEAKRQEDITLYLLVKTFAVAGLSVQRLGDLTREAVDCGEIQTERKRYSQSVTIPAGLRRELLDYAMREGVRSGPVFRSSVGTPLHRTGITDMISRLGEAAGLTPGKANPRSLKRLYQNTFAEYRRQSDEWMQESYTRLLEQEEQKVGWLAGREGGGA